MKRIMAYAFSIVLVLVLVLNIALPDRALSYSERRELEDFPVFSWESLYDGRFMSDFEDYALDQFLFRDWFRGIKSYLELYGFNKSDVNGIYLYEEHLIKRVNIYRPQSTEHFVEYIKSIQEHYLKENKIFFAIIPDKNYFVQSGMFSVIDYEELVARVKNGLTDMTYIDLMDVLTLADYYLTDTHWKQENLDNVLNALKEKMDLQTYFSEIEYIKHVYSEFAGVYLGQSALNLSPEQLIYLESLAMRNLEIFDFEDKAFIELYQSELLDGMDSYDVFLGGASPLITISNPSATTDKELILFRDSFGSSLAPLLAEEYATITLVDTRYMPVSMLEQFIEITDQDVLFLYNTEIINNSQMLK